MGASEDVEVALGGCPLGDDAQMLQDLEVETEATLEVVIDYETLRSKVEPIEASGKREKTLGGDTRPRSGMRQSDVGSNPLLSETQCQLRLSPADTDLRSPGIIIVSSVKRMQARWNTKGMAASHPCSLAVVVVGSDIII